MPTSASGPGGYGGYGIGADRVLSGSSRAQFAIDEGAGIRPVENVNDASLVDEGYETHSQ